MRNVDSIAAFIRGDFIRSNFHLQNVCMAVEQQQHQQQMNRTVNSVKTTKNCAITKFSD